MPINKLVQYCHSEYLLKVEQCSQCPNRAQGSCTSKNCSTCFQEMFFENTGRTFNCVCSTYSYVCRYIYQYSSEILHILKLLKPWFKDENGIKIDSLNVLSIGCGPCSEVFAVDSFLKEIEYNGTITYNGFDTNSIWGDVQNKAKAILPFSVNISTQNCFDYIRATSNYTYPNVLILNYLLSDICIHGNITQFINDVVENIIDPMPSRSIIIINDINLRNPRDYYKSLIQKINIKNNAGQIAFSFIGYTYGHRYNYNHTFFSLKEESIEMLIKMYGTKTLCTSAQLVILKKSNKV